MIVKLLRLASFVICLIVIASFVLFAANKTSSASKHQTEKIAGTPASESNGGSTKKESSVHKAIDEASQKLTSPFAGVVSGSNSEWLIHGVKLLIALAVYGFGLGYIARAIRIRV
jgi:hypothetical protein